MLSHDWSEFSDACTACGRTRYDAEGFACVPSTDCSDEAVREIAMITVGMRVQDNDPREPHRVMIVHATAEGKAILRHPDPRMGKAFETRVSLDRIHTEGKPRRSGWSVIAT